LGDQVGRQVEVEFVGPHRRTTIWRDGWRGVNSEQGRTLPPGIIRQIRNPAAAHVSRRGE
jgi:hypothetical protein